MCDIIFILIRPNFTRPSDYLGFKFKLKFYNNNKTQYNTPFLFLIYLNIFVFISI